MSSAYDPQPAASVPRHRQPPPSRPSLIGTFFRVLFVLVVLASFGLNLLLLAGLLMVGALSQSGSLGEDRHLNERFHSGQKGAANKIAIIHVDGVIMEGLMGYARRQIDSAAADDSVKAVVVRINSPGGSITASDDLHRRLTELRDGNTVKNTQAKPLVVSMGSLAASGGYYIAMPAKTLFAERTSITGSIGVYASFPNISKLAKDHGVKMEIIKRGEVKASGNMFETMSAEERHLWQDMIDHAYDEFLDVVKQGRGDRLKYPLQAEIKEEYKKIPDIDADGNVVKENGQPRMVDYVRRLADGGIYTADKAKKYGLIDDIGYLDDAVAEARKLAGMGSNVRVITYDKPLTLITLLTGTEASQPGLNLDLNQFANSAMPRVWYLAPQSGLSGFLAAGAAGSK
jgi:protease IV